MHKSIGKFVIFNTNEKLAGKSYLFEFVLASSNGEETLFSLYINLDKPKDKTRE